MGQKDLYQSDFYEDKRRFADVFNGCLFEGRAVMKPEELETEDSVKTGSHDKDNDGKVICDKIRKWKGKYVSVMVLENQSYVDYRMVLRVMRAEVNGYDEQRKEANRKNREAGIKFEGDEFPSEMKKGQKLVPVITLVLYLGNEKLWDGARSLYEMLEMEEELKPFVNDFKLNLFDYHEWKDFSRFKTENRLLFEALSCGRNKRKMKKMLRENPEYKALDLESARAIMGMLGVKMKLDKVRVRDEEGEVYNMCKAFDDYKEEGRREGEIQTLKTVVKNLMSNQKITFEEAAKMLGISGNKQKELRTLM